MLNELVSTFIEDSDKRLVAAQEAMRERRPADVERAAHALAGGGVVFGADPFVAVCRRLQTAGLAGDLDAIPELIDELQAEYAKLRTALLHEVEQGR